MYYRGSARKALGDPAAAAEDFEMALRLEPSNPQAAEDRRACLASLYTENPTLKPAAGVSVRLPLQFSGGDQPDTEGRSAAMVETQTRRLAEPQAAPEAAVVEVATDDDTLPPLTDALPQRIAAVAGPGVTPQQPGPIISIVEEESRSSLLAPEPLEPSQVEPSSLVAERVAPMFDASPPLVARAMQLVKPSTSFKTPKTGGCPPFPLQWPTNQTSHARFNVLHVSGVDFEKAWKGLKGDSALQSSYLAGIPAPRIPALLKQALTPSL